MVCLGDIDRLTSYEEKDIRLQTFKLKCNNCGNKESFDLKKTDGNLIEMICTTLLPFCLMNDMMQFSCPDLFNYFAKCLTMNALAK